MDNRFGFKDFIMMGLLAAILVTMWVKMVMDDRQWGRLKEIRTAIEQQTGDVTALKRAITSGQFTAPSASDNGRTAHAQNDIFRRARLVSAMEDYAQGDWFVDYFTSAPPKLNSLTAHDTYSRATYYNVVEPLAAFDIETLEMVPFLASSWKWAEDKLSLDVKLRQDVTFSDGVPMTADDVVYTWMNLMHNENITDGHTRNYIRHIKKVEKLGDYEVKFSFQKVFYENFMRAMEQVILPKHCMEKYTDQQIREHPALLLGTGPYKMRDPEVYKPGEQIELIRNERYWGEPPAFDRKIYRIIEKESAQLIEYRNGKIDLFAPKSDQHEAMLKDDDLVSRSHVKVYEHVRTGYIYIAWNQRKKDEAGEWEPTVFKNKRVRQAMTMLIDRQRVIDDVLLGYGRVANGPFHHMGPQFNPDVKTWPYDPDRAVAQLLEEGFKRADDGHMLKPDGTPFEIELVYPAGSDLYQSVMLMLKDNFAQAGIDIKLKPLKWVLLLKRLTERDFQAITLGWGAGGIEGDIEQMFHTRSIEEGDNRNGYSSEELDHLIEKAHVTLDTDDRMAIWKRCHEILHEDQPYTFFFRSKVRMWADKRIANIKSIPVFGINRVSTWPTPSEWYVPKDKQKPGNKS